MKGRCPQRAITKIKSESLMGGDKKGTTEEIPEGYSPSYFTACSIVIAKGVSMWAITLKR